MAAHSTGARLRRQPGWGPGAEGMGSASGRARTSPLPQRFREFPLDAGRPIPHNPSVAAGPEARVLATLARLPQARGLSLATGAEPPPVTGGDPPRAPAIRAGSPPRHHPHPGWDRQRQVDHRPPARAARGGAPRLRPGGPRGPELPRGPGQGAGGLRGGARPRRSGGPGRPGGDRVRGPGRPGQAGGLGPPGGPRPRAADHRRAARGAGGPARGHRRRGGGREDAAGRGLRPAPVRQDAARAAAAPRPGARLGRGRARAPRGDTGAPGRARGARRLRPPQRGGAFGG